MVINMVGATAHGGLPVCQFCGGGPPAGGSGRSLGPVSRLTQGSAANQGKGPMVDHLGAGRDSESLAPLSDHQAARAGARQPSMAFQGRPVVATSLQW